LLAFSHALEELATLSSMNGIALGRALRGSKHIWTKNCSYMLMLQRKEKLEPMHCLFIA